MKISLEKMQSRHDMVDLNLKKLNDVNRFFSSSILSAKTSAYSVGWLCTYTPEELIVAGGFIPFRIVGSKNNSNLESFFPINFCPYLKAAWESIYSINEKKLKAIILTNSCDGMRRLFDTCRKYKPDIPTYILDVPRITNENSLDFFTYNLVDLISFIEKIKGEKINNLKIEKAIELINSKRMLLKELNYIYKRLYSFIDKSTYYKIMNLSMTSNPHIFIEDLKKYINFISQAEKRKEFLISNKTYIPNIMIIGNFINEDRLWDAFSSLDCRLASEDLCLSSRYFEKLVEINSNTDLDLIKSITYRYINKPICMRMANLGLKLEEIKNSINKNNIRGVIFISLKFCDNTLYFFPLLKQKLNELKIPSLYLEIEYSNFSAGQIKTRIQAFLEML